MAIRVDVFRKIGLDKIWPRALSDDLSLGCAVKKAGMKVAFVPACLVASYESTTWRKLFEFGRRQFVITRVSAPRMWWLALCGNLCSVLGIWAGTGLAIYAAMIHDKNLPLFAAVPIVFFTSQLARAILRQKMAGRLLEHERQAMRTACIADILAFWLWSLLLLIFVVSSAFGRTICWRGIRYKLLGPTETIVEGPQAQ
jgi:ceramide glucosyltransferase